MLTKREFENPFLPAQAGHKPEFGLSVRAFLRGCQAAFGFENEGRIPLGGGGRAFCLTTLGERFRPGPNESGALGIG